jgi:fucose 4-O-acetylase-like acetyltransferase
MTPEQTTVFYGMSVFLFFMLLFVIALIYIYRKNKENVSMEDLFFLSIMDFIDSELKTDNSANCNSFITQNCEDTTTWD